MGGGMVNSLPLKLDSTHGGAGRSAEGNEWGGRTTTGPMQLSIKKQSLFHHPLNLGCLTTCFEEQNMTEIMLLRSKLKFPEGEALALLNGVLGK